MSVYPSRVTIDGQEYTFQRLLKDDFFSLNLLYTNLRHESYVLKLSDFRFVGGWLFRPLAAWISKREYTIYQMVADIPGVPALGPRFGRRGYWHRFIEGNTLHEIERQIIGHCQVAAGDPAFGSQKTMLASDFFEQLKVIMEEVHRRRIFYADLNKRGNIICSTEGKPYLIDFQICMHIPTRQSWLGGLTEKIFQRLKREDLYHLYKHKQTFQPKLMTEVEQQLAQRSKLNKCYRQLLWQPYIVLKRLIYPHGSNETIWYKWKKTNPSECLNEAHWDLSPASLIGSLRLPFFQSVIPAGMWQESIGPFPQAFTQKIVADCGLCQSISKRVLQVSL